MSAGSLRDPALETETRHEKDLWLRGGFPRSLLALSDGASATWRESFIATYLERDIPQLGPRIPAETLRRFWTMLAHRQGALLNAAELARSLAVDGKTVARYLDLLVDLLLVRRLQPLHVNVGKRLVKSPKTYLRDSGRERPPGGSLCAGGSPAGAGIRGALGFGSLSERRSTRGDRAT